MATVIIGVDPHKGSHTAVAISADEAALGQVRVRASSGQAERLLEWAQAWPQRAWAVEGARGMGHLLAQQLVAAGERVLDVQPKLGARVRLLAAGDTNKNDPNDARSVAVAALRSPGALPWRRSVEQCRSGLSVPCSPCSSYGLSAAVPPSLRRLARCTCLSRGVRGDGRPGLRGALGRGTRAPRKSDPNLAERPRRSWSRTRTVAVAGIPRARISGLAGCSGLTHGLRSASATGTGRRHSGQYVLRFAVVRGSGKYCP